MSERNQQTNATSSPGNAPSIKPNDGNINTSNESQTEVDDLLAFLEGESTTSQSTNKSSQNSTGIDREGLDTSSSQPDDASTRSGGSTPPSSTSPQDVDNESPYSEREKRLLERIEQLTSEKLERSAPKESEPDSQFQPQEHDFLEGLDIDEVLSSSSNFNKLLLGVYNKVLQESSKLSAENIMRSLPGTMSNYVAQHLSMRELVNKFYDENPELANAKKTVTDVANRIANDNPDLSIEDVFAKTAEETYKVLNLKKVEPKTKSRPTLHNSRGNGGRTRMQIPELDGLAREVNELIAD